MIARAVRPVVVVLAAFVASAVVGCSSKETVATDPDSLKKAAEEIKQMSNEENKNKKGP